LELKTGLCDFGVLAKHEMHISSNKGDSSVKLRVAVVDDSPDFLSALVSLVSSEFEIVATAVDGKSAQSILEANPDVAVLDLHLPDTDGIQLSWLLAQKSPDIAVVICSVIKDQDVMYAALEAGALAYVWKDRIASDLIQAIKSAAEGQRFTSTI
jgi:DNA-binding NarL/FixJ family response regulator